MHNNIMAVGSRDRPPMLATGRYAQWRSRFLRYIDTRPNGDALRKCILEGPYTPSTVIIPVVPAMDNSPAVPERTIVETILNMSPENKAHFESEKEAIHLILTGIGDEIYSTVDACKTAHEMWEAIERLQQGESLNIQDVKTNLFWEFGKFTSHDGESMESYYSRFYKLMNEMIRNNLTVATMQEVNEIRAERIAKNANPLALVAAAQPYQDPYYQAPKSHKSYAPTSKASLPTRSHATTRHKGKEIAKPITPPSESASEEDSDPEQAQKDKEMQKNLALIAKYFKKIYKPTNNNLRTSSNTRNKNMDTTLRHKNDNQTGQFGNQRTMTVAGARETKPKKVKDFTYHKEKMLLCKQAEKGVPLQAEQSDWLADTDEEIDEQELEAHYSYMAKIQEVPTADSGTDSEPLEQNDQNVVECDDERVALANLIGNLKLNVDENKRIQKQLKKANASLTECKSILAKTSRTLGEFNSIRDSCLVAIQNKQIGFERELVDQAWVKHSKDHFRAPTAHDMEILIKTCLMPLTLNTQNDRFVFVHELKQEIHVDLKCIESLKKEIDALKSNKAKFSNMYDMLLQECVSNDVICSYLHSLSDLDECLAQKLLKQIEFVSKKVYTELLRSCAKLEKHSISLELALQQCQEQMKNNTVCKEKASNVFQKEHEQYFEIQDLKAQLQDMNIAISELKKLVEKCKGKSVETKQTDSFLDSLERKSFSQSKSVPKTNVSESLSKLVTTQILPQTARQAVRNTNVIKPGVIQRANVSRSQLRSTQMNDKVMPNNSQVKNKKTEVEYHPRISSISNKAKSVTVSNDNLKSRTSNVNVVCATYGNCLFNSNHDACVSKYLNDVNARTKKPKVVSISTRKPKSQANKSVATPHKNTVAS
ncbi:hypothetical protein Tco_1084636 [Tanacetum coccineum]